MGLNNSVLKKGQLKKMVRDVLRDNPDTRNCDVLLTTEIWKKFFPGGLITISGAQYVRLDGIKKLPREDGVKRIRAKIQNELHQYLPTSWEVAKKRGIEENAWRISMGYSPNY